MRRVAIVINGHPRSGKDTVCQIVIQRLQAYGWRGHSISSVDPIRDMFRGLGLPVDRKTPAERDLLAEVQSALNRYDWWAIKECARMVRARFCDESRRSILCFVHIREPEAIQKFRELMTEQGIEIYTLFVDRKDAERVSSNAADARVENMTYDLTIDNNSTLHDLAINCTELAHKIMEDRIDHDFSSDRSAVA